MTVLVIGVGAMGGAIAGRLQRVGFEVLGVDPFVVDAAGRGLTETRTAEAVPVVGDLRAAAAALREPPSDVLILVRMPEQVIEVLEELDRLPFFGGVPAAVLSTLAPSDAREIVGRFGANRPLAETPVSGGIGGAGDGTLTVLVCGPTGSWLAAAAQQVMRFEEPGQPAVAKLLNNLLAAANVHALAAVLLQARELGLSPAHLMEVIGISSGASWMTPHFAGFPVDLLWKDVLLLDGDAPVQVPGLSSDTDFAVRIEAARRALLG